MKNKKGRSENWFSDSPLSISVSVDEEPLLKDLVEKLAHRRAHTTYVDEHVVSDWQLLETSSIEAYVTGSMDIFGKDEHICLAYTTCFSFTCTKLPGQENRLSWMNSLS